MVLPASVLFVMGNLFAYYLIIPFSIDFLYNFAFAMGIEQYFSVEDFFSFVLMFMLAFGVVFELPVIMVGLSSVGIVSPDFWKEHWRWAVIISLIFAAVITPDGTGVTMFMVVVPMLLLYFTGYVISKSGSKMLAVGLLLAVIGSALVLFAGLRESFGLHPGGGGYFTFGWPVWLVVGAGSLTYFIGILMAGASLRDAPGKSELPKR